MKLSGLIPFLFACGNALSSPYGQTTRNIATQVLQGTGLTSVDLNQYNLPLDVIEDEWTASFRKKVDENEAGVFLSVKNEQENFVDTVLISISRRKDSGLGILLAELAGGREDDLGITVVTGLVAGGPAEGKDILPGDSLSEVSIVRRKKVQGASLEETQLLFSVKTECCSYEKTVEAISSLSSSLDAYEDTYELKIKRIRRIPKISVKLQYPPDQGEPDQVITMYAGENLRQGMLVRGVKLNDPLAKRFDTKNGGNCGAGGLCRTCSVSVLNGGDLLNPQRVAEKQMLQDSPRWRLACKAIVGCGMKEGDMTIRVNPRQW